MLPRKSRPKLENDSAIDRNTEAYGVYPVDKGNPAVNIMMILLVLDKGTYYSLWIMKRTETGNAR
jgi:hypothetical protein